MTKMTSNPNLDILMEKIFDHEDVVNRIMETDDMFELYSLCQKIQKGYTFEEFLEFFEDLVYVCLDEAEDLKEELEKNTDKIKEVEEKQLSDVSGGVSGTQKLAASALASLMFATPAGAASPKSSGSASSNAGVHLGKGKSEDLPSWLKAAEDEKPKKKVSLGEKIRNGFNKFLDVVWDNKGKILLGSAALIGGGAYLASQSEKFSDNLKNRSENKAEIKKLEHQRDVLTSPTNSAQKKLDELAELNSKTNRSKEEEEKLKRLKEQKSQLQEDAALWDRRNKDEPQLIKDSIEAKKQERFFSQVTNGLSGVSTVAALGGGVTTAINAITKFVGKVASTASDLNNLRYYWANGAETMSAIREQLRIRTQIEETKDYNSEEGRKKLRGAFDSMVRGQEGAKDQIMSFFTNFVNELRQKEIGSSGPDTLAPKVLVFNGPSGTGKTYMAKLLSAALTKIDPYIITASDVLDASSYGVSYGFLYGKTKQGNGGKDSALSNMNVNTLESYLKATEGAVRVVIVDEWDKIYRRDTYGNRLPATHPLDETLRSIVDNKLKDQNGNVIDLTGTVFVFTTNETTASLKGRIIVDEHERFRQVEVDENGDPVLDYYGEEKTITPIKDRTGTQTLVPHDGSLMRRLNSSGSICYFDELKVEDYEDIARDALGDDRTIRNVNDYTAKGTPNKVSLKERLTHYGLGGIIISDKGYKLISEYAAEVKSGARSIVGAGGSNSGSVSGNLSAAVNEYISRLENAEKSYSNLMLWARPEIGRDSTGQKVVKFKIEALRYDDYDNYDKCLEDCNKKEAEEAKNEQETVPSDEQPRSATVG